MTFEGGATDSGRAARASGGNAGFGSGPVQQHGSQPGEFNNAGQRVCGRRCECASYGVPLYRYGRLVEIRYSFRSGGGLPRVPLRLEPCPTAINSASGNGRGLEGTTTGAQTVTVASSGRPRLPSWGGVRRFVMLVSSSSLESGAHTFPPPVATTTTSGSEDYQRSQDLALSIGGCSGFRRRCHGLRAH